LGQTVAELEKQKVAFLAEKAEFEKEKADFKKLQAIFEAREKAAAPAPAFAGWQDDDGGFGDFLGSLGDPGDGEQRSFDEINVVLAPKIGKVMSLYGKLLKKAPKMRGRLVFSFLILPNGEVSKVKIMTNTVKNAELEKMAMKLVEQCKFETVDPASKPMLVTYPMIFVPR